jgi:hypothetical protein
MHQVPSGACMDGWMDWRLIGVNYTVHPSQSQLRTQPEARGLVRKIVFASPDSTPRPARCTGKTWDTWMGKKVAVATLEPYWENPYHAARGSTWGAKPQAGTGYY